jgi:uncharacterized protein (DUF924 family)
MTVEPEEVLSFWFGELGADGKADKTHAERWWRKDDAFDALVRKQFAATWQAAMRGECDAWLEAARSCLAYVIVLDQFPRNMFRGSGQSFATDAHALAAVNEGIARGHDRALVGDERVFFYMPLMHSEALSDQERCVALFQQLRDDSPESMRETLENNVRFAERHRDIIAAWGRFPHRNALLGRASTAEELAFLKEPNSSF